MNIIQKILGQDNNEMTLSQFKKEYENIHKRIMRIISFASSIIYGETDGLLENINEFDGSQLKAQKIDKLNDDVKLFFTDEEIKRTHLYVKKRTDVLGRQLCDIYENNQDTHGNLIIQREEYPERLLKANDFLFNPFFSIFSCECLYVEYKFLTGIVSGPPTRVVEISFKCVLEFIKYTERLALEMKEIDQELPQNVEELCSEPPQEEGNPYSEIFENLFGFNFLEDLNKKLIKCNTKIDISNDVSFVYTVLVKDEYLKAWVKPMIFRNWLNKTYPEKYNLVKIQSAYGGTGELWFENELCILFADTNLGKSILAVQIGNSISKGKYIPGFKFEAEKQKILYFDFELSDKQFENRYSIEFQQHYSFDNYLLELKLILKLKSRYREHLKPFLISLWVPLHKWA